jgi:hypothetical protein
MGTFCSPVCAASEADYTFKVSFYNVCTSPVQIIASHYREKGGWMPSDEPLGVEKLLNPNESTLFFLGGFPSPEIKHTLPDDYKLEISANGKTLSLDKARFLEILKKSDYSREKCGIICRTFTFSGTIKDPSLCP